MDRGMQQQADTKSSATLILGCGYIGTALAHDLAAQGKRVVAVKRDVSQQPFVHPNVAWRQGDVTQAQGLPWEEGPYTDVVYSVSSSHGDSLAYEKAYVQGLQSVMPHLKPLPSLRRFVYLSSTGVYGQNEGQWVDESMPIDPPGKNPQLLVQAENVVLEASQRWGIPGVVLRLSGIYGPNRCHALQRLLSGMVQLELPGDRWVNMIHQQDVVRTILATFIHGPAGSVFNVSDDCPVAQKELYEWIASEVGCPSPQWVHAGALKKNKRQVTHKRVSNQKIKSVLGVRLKYPTYREGYAALVKANRPLDSKI